MILDNKTKSSIDTTNKKAKNAKGKSEKTEQPEKRISLPTFTDVCRRILNIPKDANEKKTKDAEDESKKPIQPKKCILSPKTITKSSRNEPDNSEDVNEKKAEDAKDESKETVQTEKHILPPRTLDRSTIEAYVKQYFICSAPKHNNYNPCKMIGSQVLQQTLKKLDKAYASFFALKKSKTKGNKKARPPNYLATDGYVLVFQKESFKVTNGLVKLSLGIPMKNKLLKQCPQSDGFFTVKLPTNIANRIIKEVEICAGKDTTTLTIMYKYYKHIPIIPPIKKTEQMDKQTTTKKYPKSRKTKKKREKKGEEIDKQTTTKKEEKIEEEIEEDEEERLESLDEKNVRKISFDFGMVNIAVGFSPVMNYPIIYKGGYITYVNAIYKNLIEGKYQSILKKVNGKTKSKHIARLWRRREWKITNYFHKLSSDIINVCKGEGITEIILGYNVNWKTGVNMGHANNDKFYKIPYRKLVRMIFYKGEENGIKVVEREESYTSKCDALSLERVGNNGPSVNRRIMRGLYLSSRRMRLNADVNGAINIMRKAVRGMPLIEEKIEDILRNEPKKVCNPRVRRIAV